MLNIGIYKNNNINKHYIILYLWLIILLTIICFINIKAMPINMWDEARHGVSAYEMIRENNYIANYYNGSIDYWNLKPPLSFYTIILGYKIFGYNEIGLRFFSALSYIIMSIIISIYLKNKHGMKASLLSLFFMSSLSYIFFLHCARTGDADSIFLLFFTIGLISLIKMYDNQKYIYIVGLMFSLMFLTKSFHSLFFVLIIFLYFILTKAFIKIKWYRIILFFIISILPILIWVLIRYQYDGIEFIKRMVEYDLLNRSNNSIEGHNEIFIFYFLILFISTPGLLIIMISYIIQLLKKKYKLDKEILLYLISFFVILILYTIAKSKLVWYIYPAFIPLVLISAITYSKININNIYNKIRKIAFCIISLNVIASLIYTIFICLSFDFIAVGKYEGAYEFIKEIEIKQIDLYIEYENRNEYYQNDLLYLKLYLDAYCHNGGIGEFENNNDCYLILDKKNINKIDINNYQIIKENDNYLLIYKN